MQQIRGSWARIIKCSYFNHRFRRPFGSPVDGGFGGMLGGGGFARMRSMPAASMAVPEGAMAKGAVAFSASDEMMMEDASTDIQTSLNSVTQKKGKHGENFREMVQFRLAAAIWQKLLFHADTHFV